jgi:3-oxoacyl-[acyl-carrier-protein] synthase III
MLAEFLQTREVKAGEKIFCFIPESGQISAAYMLFEVDATNPYSSLGADAHGVVRPLVSAARATAQQSALAEPDIPAPHDPANASPQLSEVLKSLATIWHDYRSQVWRTPVIRCLVQGRFTVEHYRNWTAQWVPQVREGSLWMREAVASLAAPFAALGGIIETHASEEQHDFKILYNNYQAAGGTKHLEDLKRNPGGEALNSYLHSIAATVNPVDLLGAIYIIEGTGQRIVPALLPMLKAQVALPASAFKFLDYHGSNDVNHLARWLQALELALTLEPSAASRIIETAQHTAHLYLMQFKHIQHA